MTKLSTHKHEEQFSASKIRIVTFISLLFGFMDAFLVYILSSYFRQVIGTDNVSPFYLFSYAFALLFMLYFHILIRKVGKSLLLFLFFVVLIVTNAFLVLAPMVWWSALFLMVHLVVANLVWVNLDILLESFSVDSRSGRIRGLYLAITNVGWMAAPFLATRVLDQYGFGGVFTVELILSALVLMAAILGLRMTNGRFREKTTPQEILGKIRRKSDILRVYHLSFAIEFFYAIMVVYVPLHLLNLGVSWSDMGIIFTIMLIPFAVVQYPLGRLADKRLGEKELLIVSVFLTGLASLALIRVHSGDMWIWAGMLFLTRIGSASVDVLRDSYFYKRIDGRDMDIIAFFRTARPVANIAAAVCAGLTLFLFDIPTLFVLTSLIVFSSLVSVVLLEDNVSEHERRAGAPAF